MHQASTLKPTPIYLALSSVLTTISALASEFNSITHKQETTTSGCYADIFNPTENFTIRAPQSLTKRSQQNPVPLLLITTPAQEVASSMAT